ncbi:leucine-rich repeat and WD repeat-containing protein 1-like [Lycorma delicatula]|uniref:leucine-rich repeat and WD repeat-containing protein 1-like n=1 Tax=Lycorma delicatula TaxID=130591 RepID=UPI003F516760
MDFNPVHFLRCHSRKNDNADVQTQVWMCVFEPDPKDLDKTTNLVATCGGNSICFIDVTTGDVVAKYVSKDLREMFYSLAWTTLPNGINVLACGGARNVIHLINKSESVSFLQYPLKLKPKLRIQALLFHPESYNILFCGTSDGDVRVCDIGTPIAPDYKTDFKILSRFSAESEIFSLALCTVTNVLLAGCNDGLRGWHVIKPFDTSNSSVELLHFNVPQSNSESNCDTELVDSVEVLKDGVVATKCALQAAIYIWYLPSTVGNLKKTKCNSFTVAPTHILHWSNTDNYFMYIGAHIAAGLLCCGDDEGALWLYDISELDFKHNKVKPVLVEPTAILPWPYVTDSNSENKRKLNLDVYDIVVDKVAVDSTGKYIVAVTNNNMVCIWEKA